MPILTFEFDELPLVIANGFEAGLIAGSAEINYDADGLWSVASISLDGHRKAHYSLEQRVAHEVVQGRLPERMRRPLPSYDRKPVELDAGSPLYSMITDALEGMWAGSVQDAVREALAADHDDAPARVADLRREHAAMVV